MQYSLAYTFDSDGATSTFFFLENTYLSDTVEVCVQYMPFSLFPVDSEDNYKSAVYQVPMISNPMIYDNLDCTFGQAPKSGAGRFAPAMLTLAGAALIALLWFDFTSVDFLTQNLSERTER